MACMSWTSSEILGLIGPAIAEKLTDVPFPSGAIPKLRFARLWSSLGVSRIGVATLWDDCPYTKSNANTFVHACAYRVFLTLCVGIDLGPVVPLGCSLGWYLHTRSENPIRTRLPQVLSHYFPRPGSPPPSSSSTNGCFVSCASSLSLQAKVPFFKVKRAFDKCTPTSVRPKGIFVFRQKPEGHRKGGPNFGRYRYNGRYTERGQPPKEIISAVRTPLGRNRL